MKWWQEAVVYQIYPRSFKDSNGDGIGDIRGIISKLDYMAYLGVNVIWLSPVYESPNDDNGYDISDYYGIMEEFGTMEDMDELIAEADSRGIRIVMDLVANHTSTSHDWFVQAVADRNSKYHDYYYFRENQGKLPDDTQSVFLGPAWELNEELNEYYLHMFARSQADLNWHNEEVRKDLYRMINWWLDKGIGGFRLDVIDFVAKETDRGIITDGPRLDEYIRELTENTFSRYDVMTVGETWGADTEKAIRYSNLDSSELSMIFNFSHILLDQDGNEKWDFKDIDLTELKKNLADRQNGLYRKGWDALFWNNHDLPRIVSRWGNDGRYRVESAKLLATVLHFMQGTPYIYQGEEIGMTNVKFENIEDYRDIETLNMYNDRLAKGYSEESIFRSIYHIGRDNARTPMQWDDSEYGGFSGVEPWIAVNPNYREINVAQQLGAADSILEYYRMLIWYRRKSEFRELIREGSFELLDAENPDIFAYRRRYNGQVMTVICNFHDRELKYPNDFGKLLISNYPDNRNDINLRPYESRVYMVVE